MWENFDALTTDPGHPSRSHLDTFYLDDDTVLRTHTSPDQIRAMLARKPPIYMISPGRCYRRDTPDATHSPTFLQVEALVVDRHITLADLRGTVLQFVRELFGQERDVRMRTSFFPFTEPSVEFDITCFICGGAGCATCKHSGWIEMGGAGCVDPDVLRNVGLDPEEWSGFAFGLGIERIAMLRHGLPDLRAFWENDLRVLGQFLKVPARWLAEYVDIDLPLEELARQLVFTSCEVDRIVRRGVPDTRREPRAVRRRPCPRGREASGRRQAAADEGRRRRARSPPDRVRRPELRRGRDGRRRPARARSCRAASRSRSGSSAASTPTG